VFLKLPTYSVLIQRLGNEAGKLLAIARESVKFELELVRCGCTESSFPLFKNNPTGRERWKDGFNHKRNMIGRLTIKDLKLF
jgi:hypothetical protein